LRRVRGRKGGREGERFVSVYSDSSAECFSYLAARIVEEEEACNGIWCFGNISRA